MDVIRLIGGGSVPRVYLLTLVSSAYTKRLIPNPFSCAIEASLPAREYNHRRSAEAPRK